jgi:hypothetical protein
VNRLPLLGVALASLLFSAPGARADLIPWTYNWAPGPTVVTSDTGAGRLELTNEPLGHALGDSDIVATNIKAFSSALPDAPDVFTNRPYALSMTLKDTASGATGVLTFTGAFSGTLTAGSANISYAFTGLTTQTLTLGGNTYTVTIGNYAPPAPPGAINAGAISAFAQVSVSPAGAAPEPSACALACVGLASAAGAFWRRRKRRHGA